MAGSEPAQAVRNGAVAFMGWMGLCVAVLRAMKLLGRHLRARHRYI
jgi:hypothetical protein